jgi:hypothetical protein
MPLNMSNQQRVNQSQRHNQDIAHMVLLAIKDIHLGSVEVVHDSKVVQIEREEKIRFDIHQSQPPRKVPMTIQRCCHS